MGFFTAHATTITLPSFVRDDGVHAGGLTDNATIWPNAGLLQIL